MPNENDSFCFESAKLTQLRGRVKRMMPDFSWRWLAEYENEVRFSERMLMKRCKCSLNEAVLCNNATDHDPICQVCRLSRCQGKHGSGEEWQAKLL